MYSTSVSPGLNERAAGRASWEGACRNVRPDAPNKNYTIEHNTLIVNKRQTIRFVKITILCTECSTLIIVKSTLNDPINVKVLI